MDASSQKNCQKQNLRNWKEIEDYRKNKHSIKKMPFELMDIIEYNNAFNEEFEDEIDEEAELEEEDVEEEEGEEEENTPDDETINPYYFLNTILFF